MSHRSSVMRQFLQNAIQLQLFKQVLPPVIRGEADSGTIQVGSGRLFLYSLILSSCCCLLSDSGAEAFCILRGGWIFPLMVSELKDFSYLGIPRPKIPPVNFVQEAYYH